MNRLIRLVLAITYWSAVAMYAGELRGNKLHTNSRAPNIVFIMTDDQAPWALGAAGNVDARTPHMDRLRSDGALLANCFVATPVCSPSRASLLTSRYGTEVGITDYLSPGRMPELGLDPKFKSWPRFLEDAGYATAFVGKWHVGQKDPYLPVRHGYREFTGFRVGAGTSKNPSVEVNGKVRQIEGYTPDILTDFAMDFIRRSEDERFLLSLHFWAPHANTKNRTPDGDRTWLPLSDADWEPFKGLRPKIPNPDYPKLDMPRVKRMMREYLASVASVDRSFGRLLTLLDELKLTRNTVVIFTSDHGYNMGHNGIWHKGNGRWILTDDRGHRPNLYDNSLRVPAIVRWPGVIRPGTTIKETTSHLDWYPTILAIVGLALPEDQTIRGRSFLPLLKGKCPKWNNDLYVQYRMWSWHQTGADLRAYRTSHWKLIRDFKHEGKDELYDLLSDPAETRNLIDAADPEIQKQRQKLNARLVEKMREISDPALSGAVFGG